MHKNDKVIVIVHKWFYSLRVKETNQDIYKKIGNSKRTSK